MIEHKDNWKIIIIFRKITSFVYIDYFYSTIYFSTLWVLREEGIESVWHMELGVR